MHITNTQTQAKTHTYICIHIYIYVNTHVPLTVSTPVLPVHTPSLKSRTLLGLSRLSIFLFNSTCLFFFSLFIYLSIYLSLYATSLPGDRSSQTRVICIDMFAYTPVYTRKFLLAWTLRGML